MKAWRRRWYPACSWPIRHRSARSGSTSLARIRATSRSVKAAFFGDVDQADFETFRKTLHCDEPAQVAVVPSAVTKERFAAWARHYIHCDADQAITPDGHSLMVAMVDEAMANKTHIHRLPASHSPFLSQPEPLAELLLRIAG